MFKDIIGEYYHRFYILMSNKTECLYDLIFKSIKRIMTQQDIYEIQFLTITTDTEIVIENVINNNFIVWKEWFVDFVDFIWIKIKLEKPK